MSGDAFSIPDNSESGSKWEAFSFLQWAKRMPSESRPYKIKPLMYLRSVYREYLQILGVKRGRGLFFRAMLWDCLFNRPQWMPDRFKLYGKNQEMFYRKKFNANLTVLVFFRALAGKIGTADADRIIANTLVPIVLDMMKTKYDPVEKIDSVETWLKQARGYLGREIEENSGFDGTLYLSDDKSELRLHVTRCVNMEILREYGLIYTAAALCMCDHVTYHTVFPNLVFKRSHNLAIGDKFCDHEIRIKTDNKPSHDENDYSDCIRAGLREFVREWEDKSKAKIFGSLEEWEAYAERSYSHRQQQ